MSADIQLTAGIDFTGAKRDADAFVKDTVASLGKITQEAQRAAKSLKDIKAKAEAPGGSQSRPGGGSSGGGSRSALDTARQEIANQRALEAAKNRVLGMDLRIQRQLQGNAELSARATRALDGYSRALSTHGTRTLDGVKAQSAFRMEMTRLNHEIAKTGGLLPVLNRGFSGTIAAVNALGSAYSSAGGQLGIALTGFSALAVRASDGAQSTTAFSGSLRTLASGAALATAGVAAVAAVTWTVAKATTEAHDKVTMLQQRFTVLSGSAEGGQVAFAALVKSANTMGVSIEDGAQAMSRFILAGRNIGLTTQDAGLMADTFLKMGRIVGATTQELQSGMIQYGQALASGKLAGDEFRALNEAMPTVLQAIAKELGVSSGALKEMSSEGRITADVMTNALLNAAKDVDKQFGQLPRTASAMGQEIQNNFTLLLADLDNLFAGSALVKSVYGFFNDAINKARGLLTTTDEERIAELEGKITTHRQRIEDRKSSRFGSPFNDQQDRNHIETAETELAGIRKRIQDRAQREREDDLQAALQRELATRTRHQQAVDKIQAGADPLAKAAKERDTSLKSLREALDAGAIGEDRYRSVVAAVNAEYDETVRRANKRETTLDKARAKMADRIAEIGHETANTVRLADATLKGADAYAEVSRQMEIETHLRELNRQAKEAGIKLDEREARSKLEAAAAAERYNDATQFARNLVDQHATPQEQAARRLTELKRNYDELLKSGNPIPKEVETAFDRARVAAVSDIDVMYKAFKDFAGSAEHFIEDEQAAREFAAAINEAMNERC